MLEEVPALLPKTLCAQTLVAAVLFLSSDSTKEKVLNFFSIQAEGKVPLPSAYI